MEILYLWLIFRLSGKGGRVHQPARQAYSQSQHGIVLLEVPTSSMILSLHCNPGEAYVRLITASCEAGPGATPICTFQICIWRILILEFADRFYFCNSTFDLSKCHLYREMVRILKISCQGSNLRPTRFSQYVIDLKVFPARIEPATFRSVSRSLHQYTKKLSYKYYSFIKSNKTSLCLIPYKFYFTCVL